MVSNRSSNYKVGRVSIDLHRHSTIRLRWRYRSHPSQNSKRYELTIGSYDKPNWQIAIATAQKIDSDILLGQFDTTLDSYRVKNSEQVQPLQTASSYSPPRIKKIWETYKERNQDKVSLSHQQKRWRLLTNLLERLDYSPYATSSDIHKLMEDGRQYYSNSSLISINDALSACLNWARTHNYQVENPCVQIRKQLQKGRIKKKPDCFENWEVKTIITAFREDYYHYPDNPYRKSHYYHYVYFLALTGFRPEEAIALTWDDLIIKRESAWIKVDKAYTQGRLNTRTKTGSVRAFPINQQLLNFIETIPKLHPTLVFPSQGGGYINHHNFSQRIWKPMLQKLLQDGLIHQYLSPYHLRHTFITNLIREGYDIGTVSRLAGNSPKVIIDSYLSATSDKNLPEFNF